MRLDRCRSHVLLFLARFKEFLEALAEDRKPDAAKIVLACFGEGLVPEGFSAVLLLDTTQLLEVCKQLSMINREYGQIQNCCSTKTTPASYSAIWKSCRKVRLFRHPPT
jgi:hypothetical protein